MSPTNFYIRGCIHCLSEYYTQPRTYTFTRCLGLDLNFLASLLWWKMRLNHCLISENHMKTFSIPFMLILLSYQLTLPCSFCYPTQSFLVCATVKHDTLYPLAWSWCSNSVIVSSSLAWSKSTINCSACCGKILGLLLCGLSNMEPVWWYFCSNILTSSPKTLCLRVCWWELYLCSAEIISQSAPRDIVYRLQTEEVRQHHVIWLWICK